MKYEIMDDYILRFNDDGSVSSIPTDPANSDYQAYLAAQSTPSIPEGGN
jgi:hypothetical protein